VLVVEFRAESIVSNTQIAQSAGTSSARFMDTGSNHNAVIAMQGARAEGEWNQ